MNRTLAVVLAVLLVMQGGFGVAVAADNSSVSEVDGPPNTTAAATGSIELEAATDESGTETLSFTFVADANETVTATDRIERDGGNVVFEFYRWEDLDGSRSSTSNSWSVEAGHEYRVSYDVVASPDTTEGYYSGTVSVSGQTSESLSVDVSVLEPQFGSVYGQETDLVFESVDAASTEVDVDISNTGDGEMRGTNVTFSGVPTGMTVDSSGLDDQIDAGGTDTLTLDIAADETVSEGSYQVDVTVTDNLGNSESFPVYITVEKPPVLGVASGSEVDVGDVLVGSQSTIQFTVNEEAGYSGISGVTSRVIGSSQQGSISFSGLRYVSTSPGGSDTAEVTISAPDDARQHSVMEWDVRLSPDDADGVSETVTFTSRVIYPAQFGEISSTDTSMVFDEPRSRVGSYTEEVEVTVPNSGDLDMDVTGVRAETNSREVNARVIDRPNTIQGQSEGTVTVEVEADSDAAEGDYSVDVTVTSADAGQESATATVDITHEVSLSVESTSVTYGDIVVTRNLTRSVGISEDLGYKDVSNLMITRQSGPDNWLTVVERPPSNLVAGEAAPFVVAVQFDTSATLYQEYEWTFRVDGEGIEARTVTVTATPKPYSFDQIRDPLSEYTGTGGWQDETASGMVMTLDTIEEDLRSGDEVSREDLSTGIAAGQSTLLFIDSVESARETRENEGPEAAQSEVVRAAATYNLLENYISEFDDPDLRSSADRSGDVAEEQVTALIDQQRSYYQSRLDDSETTMIERARIQRQLAQLESLQGNEEQAQALREESAAAFDEYSALIQEGNEHRRAARDRRTELYAETAMVVLGQPVVLNPASWDRFESAASTIDESYVDSRNAFESAGAAGEAGSVERERQQVANELQTARYSLYVSTGIYIIMFLGLMGYIVRGTYAYVRDAREAVSGDFLVS